jgi:hypothetical protein
MTGIRAYEHLISLLVCDAASLIPGIVTIYRYFIDIVSSLLACITKA